MSVEPVRVTGSYVAAAADGRDVVGVSGAEPFPAVRGAEPGPGPSPEADGCEPAGCTTAAPAIGNEVGQKTHDWKRNLAPSRNTGRKW